MQRLKTHSQFRAVLAGPRIGSTAHFVLHQCDMKDAGLQFSCPIAHDDCAKNAGSALLHASFMGAMVPKRWAKRAVTRNMIKRQIYNAASWEALALPTAAYVVRLRAGFDRQRFVSASSSALKHQVRQELISLFSIPLRPASALGCMSTRQP